MDQPSSSTTFAGLLGPFSKSGFIYVALKMARVCEE